MSRRFLLAAVLLAGLAFAGAVAAQPADSTMFDGVHWRVSPAQPCAAQPVAVVFDACRCNVTFVSGGLDASGGIVVRFTYNPLILCFRCDPESLVVPLGAFEPGSYTVAIHLVAEIPGPDSTSRTETADRLLGFQVTQACPPPPPPPSGPLPYVTSILIGRPQPCPECNPLACAGDSIPVIINGVFPDDCIGLKSVELVPSPIVGPLPEPEMLLITYQVNSCLGRPCIAVPQPWSAMVMLSPLPIRQYYLLARALQLDQCTGVTDILGSTSLPFAVVDSCDTLPPPPPGACFLASFERSGERCDAFVSRGVPAEVTLDMTTGVALAGLQGRFLLTTPDLRVAGVEPVGPAAGMHVQWAPTADGASFVLFAEGGAPIPVAPFSAPVLRVAVADRPGVPIPDIAQILPVDLLGSDSLGGAVGSCPIPFAGMPIPMAGATLCGQHACDLNGDGIADIRDLVLQVHCILGTGFCPDTTAQALDCNQDGVKSLDDVLCCAHTILRGGMPGDTTGSRRDPAVAVRLRDPARTATGVDVPLTLMGADHVGAARFEMSFPADRYDMAGVDLAGNPPGWLSLSEVKGDRVVVGLIGLGGASAGSAVDLLVHLSLRPGQSAGGEAALVATQLSGTDGVTLAVDPGQPVRPLGPPATVALSPARPNPFARETRFTVTLGQAADLDVTIYDLQGRKVAGLFHGAATAGSVDLVWPRKRDNGAPVASGIYFVRAAVGGEVATRKVMVSSRE